MRTTKKHPKRIAQLVIKKTRTIGLLAMFMTLGFPMTVFSLQKDTLRVGYNKVPPFVVQMEDEELMGPSVWLWENIAEENDLPFKYIPLPLDELLDGLRNNKIDIGLSPLTITSERVKFMDFTSPYYIANSSMLELEVTALERSWLFVKSFFSVNFIRALGALVLVILVFGILIWLFERRTNQEEFGGGIRGVWEGFWWSAVTMTTVGYGDKSPRTVGGRLVSLIWMFTAIIIISGFTASIASSLTLNSIDSAHGSLGDFKQKKLGTVENSATNEWLKNNFFTNKEELKTMDELLIALDRSQVDAIAYDRPVLQTIIKNDTLSKYRLPDITYNPQFYAFGLSNQLPDSISQLINYAMLSHIEKMDWKVLLAESGLE